MILMMAATFPFFLVPAASASENAESSASPVSSTTARGEPAPPAPPPPSRRRLAIGVNDLGGQLRIHFTPEWAAEARFMTGSASSNEGGVHSMVFGLRLYRFSQEHRRCRLYLGLEGDRAQTSIRGQGSAPNSSPTGGITTAQNFGNTSGFAAGGFGGVELRLSRRVAVDFDMGPYLISLKEQVSGVSGSNWDFVVNTAVNLYLF